MDEQAPTAPPPLPAENVEEAGAPVPEKMILRKSLRENHGVVVRQVLFNTVDSDMANLIGTVGGKQANIYDNQNCGDYLDLMCHYIHDSELFACAWLKSPPDARLAVAGADGFVYIISVIQKRVVERLAGHEDTVRDLAAHLTKPALLLSAGDDGVRLWDVTTNRCLAVYNAVAASVCFRGASDLFLTGGAGEEVTEWALPADLSAADGEKIDDGRKIALKLKSAPIQKLRVECVRCPGAEGGFARFNNGTLVAWDHDASGEAAARLLWKHADSNEDGNRFAIAAGGDYLALPHKGTVKVLKLAADAKASDSVSLETGRKSSFTGAQFSHDMRYVVASGENGYLWRWDYYAGAIPEGATRFSRVVARSNGHVGNGSKRTTAPKTKDAEDNFIDDDADSMDAFQTAPKPRPRKKKAPAAAVPNLERTPARKRKAGGEAKQRKPRKKKEASGSGSSSSSSSSSECDEWESAGGEEGSVESWNSVVGYGDKEPRKKKRKMDDASAAPSGEQEQAPSDQPAVAEVAEGETPVVSEGFAADEI